MIDIGIDLFCGYIWGANVIVYLKNTFPWLEHWALIVAGACLLLWGVIAIGTVMCSGMINKDRW